MNDEFKPLERRPKRGDRFIHRHLLRPDAKPPYRKDSYQERTVTATRNHPGGTTVYHVDSVSFGHGDTAGSYMFPFHAQDKYVREWLTS